VRASAAKDVRSDEERASGRWLKQLFGSFAGAVENAEVIIHLEINRSEPGYPIKLPRCDPVDHSAFSSGKSYVMATGS
jgi:hypothetical protein